MRKLCLLFLLLSFLLLTSCEFFYDEPEEGVMRILVYGDTYHTEANHVSTIVLGPDGTEHGVMLSAKGNQIPPAANDAVQVGNALVSHAKKSGKTFQITYMIDPNRTDLVSGEGDLEDRIKALEEKGILKENVNYRISHSLDVDSVLEEITELTKDAKENDLFIFYYSGHGVRGDGYTVLNDRSPRDYGDELKKDAYFWMFDGESYQANGSLKPGATVTRGSTLVSFSYLYQQIEKVNGRKLLLLDNCYSGCMVDVDGFSVDSTLYKDKDMLDLFFSPGRITVSPSTFVLAASEYYNTSTFNESPINSDFTLHFLKALGWDVKRNALTSTIPAESWGAITLHGLASYLQEDYDYKGSSLDNGGKISVSGGSWDLVLF